MNSDRSKGHWHVKELNQNSNTPPTHTTTSITGHLYLHKKILSSAVSLIIHYFRTHLAVQAKMTTYFLECSVLLGIHI